MTMLRKGWTLLAVSVPLLLSGCMSPHMVKSESTNTAPPSGMAMLVFLRPATMGGDPQSSVYEVSPDQQTQTFIGILSYNTKLAYPVRPGHHLFMVIGENADFMDADLVAGKTYYALVSGRIGVINSRYSLLPVHTDPAASYSIASKDFSGWQSQTSFVEKGPTADQWYAEQKSSIDEKRVDYLKKWNGRTAADKADLYLHKNDGS